jgi:hypothetical protein
MNACNSSAASVLAVWLALHSSETAAAAFTLLLLLASLPL